jgi:hypothetical protein
MGRRGRPRKNRSRHNNGHEKPPAIPSPRQIAAQMPHRKGLGDNASNPMAESELGRMLLRGDLGDDGVVLELAGSTYGRMWRNYLITLAGPAAILNGGGHGLTCGGCQSDEERRYCRCSMRKNIFLEAQNALFANGPLVGSTVRDTVCNDRRCDRIDLLRHGLAALAYHFGLAKRQNRALNSHSHHDAAPHGAVCVSVSGR